MDLISARCRPNTFSIASEISPTVALARAASIASASRLPLPSPALRGSAASAASTSFWLRSERSRDSLSIWSRRTVEFSTLSTSIGASSMGLYLLTPITACLPASIRACVLAEASSIRSLGTPASIALAMPPSSSTSWMCPQEVEELGGMAKAIEAGVPKLRIEEASAKTQARIDAGRQAVIGVNKYKPIDEAPIDVLKVENSTVRRLQIDKLSRLRSERNQKDVDAALAALTRSAGEGNGNLLALAIDAARAKATVGEISDAMEKVFGRHRAEIKSITGVYKREAATMSNRVEKVQALIDAFEEAEGRRPRILVAKIGQDGHDRGQKVIASAFADVGFDVDIGPLFATADEAARQAVENDVHILGVSSLAAAHLTAVPELKAALKKQGREDIMIIVGGVVPPQDYDALYKAGAEAIFPPGTVISDAADELIHKLNARLGHSEAAE